VNYVGCSAVTDLRNTVFDKVVRQGAQFFEAHSTGRLMSSIMNDIEKIQVAVSHILADLLRQTFVVLGLLFVILNMDWKLALASLTVLPFVLIPTARIGRRIRRTSRRSQDHAAELNEILQETLSGHQVVKAFGTEQYESGRFRQTAQRLLKTNLRYVRQQALASPLIEIFGALTIVGLLTYARTQIKAHTLTAGEFTSFVIALLMMYEPVKRLTGIHNIFEQAIGASQKVFEYLAHAEEIQEKPGAVKLERFTGAIRFEKRRFPLSAFAQWISVEGPQSGSEGGEVVAVVGRAARARPRWLTWCRDSTTSPPAPCASTGGMYAISIWRRCGGWWGSWRRILSCSTTPRPQYRLRPARHADERDPRRGAIGAGGRIHL